MVNANTNTNFDRADANARQVIRRTKQITRRRFSPEEKCESSLRGSVKRSRSLHSVDGKALLATSYGSGKNLLRPPHRPTYPCRYART